MASCRLGAAGRGGLGRAGEGLEVSPHLEYYWGTLPDLLLDLIPLPAPSLMVKRWFSWSIILVGQPSEQTPGSNQGEAKPALVLGTDMRSAGITITLKMRKK